MKGKVREDDDKHSESTLRITLFANRAYRCQKENIGDWPP